MITTVLGFALILTAVSIVFRKWILLVSLLAGSIPGVIIGSYVSTRIPDKGLRPVLASTLAVVGARLSF